MTPVVVDTHAAVWYQAADPSLSAAARRALEDATAAGAPLYLSAISLVELGYLIEKGRLPQTALDRLLHDLDDPSAAFHLVPVDRDIARAVPGIPRADVPDMPDRIIAATALHLNVPLVSRDRKIQTAPIRTIW